MLIKIMKKKNRIKNITQKTVSFVVVISLMISVVYSPPAKAAEINCDKMLSTIFGILSDNNILNWNPCDQECSSAGGNGSGALGKNIDYKGNTIFVEEQMDKIKKYMSVYQEAAKVANVPWQTIAVMHARETGLSLRYPANAQGIYQFYAEAGNYPTGRDATEEEFLAQSIHAGEFLRGKVPGKEGELAAGDTNVIKEAFFGYNGRAAVYKAQALALGFDQAGADRGEGSPYVMNMADDKRDSSENPRWGQIKRDSGPIEYPANRDHGAFVMYAALTDGVQTASSCGTSMGPITEGGLTEEQARKFIMNYGKNPNNFSSKAAGANMWNLCQGNGANCVTFSAFFMTAFTELTPSPSDGRWGNGNDVVSRQAAKGVETGTTPRPFAVFSYNYEDLGHTGIVLGIHGDTVIVGHASCGRGGKGEGDSTKEGTGAGYVLVSKLDNLAGAFQVTDGLKFAYPKDVDTNKINEFLNM